jgi:hypothetical protein
MTKIHLQAAARLQREVTELEKKEWIGLTKEDVESILEDAAMDGRGYVMAMTEAILREKNK